MTLYRHLSSHKFYYDYLKACCNDCGLFFFLFTAFRQNVFKYLWNWISMKEKVRGFLVSRWSGRHLILSSTLKVTDGLSSFVKGWFGLCWVANRVPLLCVFYLAVLIGWRALCWLLMADICLCVFSFRMLFPAAAMVPGTVLSAGDTVVRETDNNPCLSRAHVVSSAIKYLATQLAGVDT